MQDLFNHCLRTLEASSVEFGGGWHGEVAKLLASHTLTIDWFDTLPCLNKYSIVNMGIPYTLIDIYTHYPYIHTDTHIYIYTHILTIDWYPILPLNNPWLRLTLGLSVSYTASTTTWDLWNLKYWRVQVNIGSALLPESESYCTSVSVGTSLIGRK